MDIKPIGFNIDIGVREELSEAEAMKLQEFCGEFLTKVAEEDFVDKVEKISIFKMHKDKRADRIEDLVREELSFLRDLDVEETIGDTEKTKEVCRRIDEGLDRVVKRAKGETIKPGTGDKLLRNKVSLVDILSAIKNNKNEVGENVN
jgi:hypothetical protein